MTSVQTLQTPKTAIITGGTGYVGNQLAKHLSKQGWQLTLITRTSSKKAKNLDAKYIEYDGTIESLAGLNPSNQQDSVVFHLATDATITSEANQIEKTIDANIKFGTHLLSCMLKQGLRNIVITESYWQFDAHGELSGNTLYASSKSAFSIIAKYFSTLGLKTISLVLYDIYGPNDPRKKLINTIKSLTNKESFIELTPGEQLLDFVHIDDVIAALETAGETLTSTKGATKTYSRHTVRSMETRRLKDFIDILCESIESPPTLLWGAKRYPRHQIMTPWFPDNKKQLPDWTPKHSFESGIRNL